MEQIIDNVKKVKVSSRGLSTTDDNTRKSMLLRLAKGLKENAQFLFAENEKDVSSAKENGLKESILHRLIFSQEKLDSAVAGLEMLATLADPLGKIKERRLLDEDMLLEKVTVPIGVIGMIFEARPDAMIQIIGLALRTGNGIILKGGKEAKYSNEAILKVVQESLDGEH